jgi:hypothetical protein
MRVGRGRGEPWISSAMSRRNSPERRRTRLQANGGFDPHARLGLGMAQDAVRLHRQSRAGAYLQTLREKDGLTDVAEGKHVVSRFIDVDAVREDDFSVKHGAHHGLQGRTPSVRGG